MKNILKLLALSLFITLAGCVNSDEYKTPTVDSECADLTATKPVTIFNTYTLPTAPPVYPNKKQYTDDDIIEAYVTSSDEGGNFYKSISLVALDDAIGISIPVDDYNLYTKYPPGTKVFVNLKNLYYQKDADAFVVGGLYNNNTPTNTSDDEIGRIPGVLYQSIITRACTGSVNEDNLVHNVTITQARSAQYLNKLIEIDNVQFADGSAGKKYFDPTVNNIGSATNHTITDADGNTVIVRVSQYAGFASETVPTLSGTIRGVMTKFGSTYQFMIRTLDDVKLTNPRIMALFEEGFTTNFPNWVKFSVTGAQVWSLNANGNPGNCADMNGFSGGAVVNEDWLISPAIDLTGLTTPKLTFQTAKNFSGNALQVYVSTNYSGSGTPTAATWTLLSATMATASNFVWTNSGNVSLTPYAGNANVRIAFKYTSTASAAAEWRVDNVKVN
jgi:hypothetical protein